MTFHILSIFPKVFENYFNSSILKRAQEKKLIKIKIYDIRKFAKDKHRTTDDRPYGGGVGMVMKAEPIVKAVQDVLKRIKNKESRIKKTKIILLSAKGRQFNQTIARNWSKRFTDIILICGRYEGVDERVKKILKAEEISIGPYILTDGDAAAVVIISSVARLIPGVIKLESVQEESHWKFLGDLEYPHYTRPEVVKHKGKKYRVPKVLLSGDHEKIKEWRKKQSKLKI